MLGALGVPVTEQATRAINAALIVAADHDLASATLAARIAASVGAGLHEGPGSRSRPTAPAAARVGLPLYPPGDPRATYLIDLALRIAPVSRAVELASKFVDQVRDNIGIHANLEVGLAILAFALGLTRRSSGALWVVGRTAGWIAHVLEQRRAGHMLRPRGHYVAQAY